MADIGLLPPTIAANFRSYAAFSKDRSANSLTYDETASAIALAACPTHTLTCSSRLFRSLGDQSMPKSCGHVQCVVGAYCTKPVQDGTTLLTHIASMSDNQNH